MKLQKKKSLAQKRRWRIRKKVRGTAERPRLTVHFSNKHIYAQCIDDVAGHTLAYISSVGSKDAAIKANSEGAVVLGKTIADKAKSAGIESVVFDRAGRRYHGCVKSFAEAARQGGLQF
ncbi:MAG: 50S ribosomal protein L18 [Opitutales bacterium]